MILKEEWLLLLASTLYGNKVLPSSKYLPDMLGSLYIFEVTVLHCITKMRLYCRVPPGIRYKQEKWLMKFIVPCHLVLWKEAWRCVKWCIENKKLETVKAKAVSSAVTVLSCLLIFMESKISTTISSVISYFHKLCFVWNHMLACC